MRKFSYFILSILLLVSFTLCKAIEKHYALIIGNTDYSVSPLKNPVNDAKVMEKTLQEVGFEVTTVYNVGNKSDFHTLVKKFVNSLGAKDVGLFYYSGHGMQLQDKNYLIPTRAVVNSESDVEFEGYDIDRLLVELQNKQNALNIIILDACRDNPFVRSFRSTTKGLAMIDRSVPDCLIVYSTAPGNVASDEGLFTEELAKAIKIPEMDLTDVMMSVRENVKKRSANKQLPWETSLLTKKFSFYKGIYGGDFPKPTIKLDNPWKSQKWIGTSAFVLNTFAILYFKSTADEKYDDYKKASTSQSATDLHKQVENNQKSAKYSSYFIPIPIGYMVYGWWQDSRIKVRERELNERK